MKEGYLIDKMNNVAFDMAPKISDPEEMIELLYKTGVVQFGEFKLKSGMMSPLYIDLRKTITYPHVLKQLLEAMWNLIQTLNFDLICGVPLTAVVFSSYLSVSKGLPMILCRKEVKDHGTKKKIEGEYFSGQSCLIIEDLITSGASVLETIEPLRSEGLVVEDIALLIDREQGGRQKLESLGYRVHSLFTLSEILTVLEQKEKITLKEYRTVTEFILNNQVSNDR
jgi:uridine monophosphate synthetase